MPKVQSAEHRAQAQHRAKRVMESRRGSEARIKGNLESYLLAWRRWGNVPGTKLTLASSGCPGGRALELRRCDRCDRCVCLSAEVLGTSALPRPHTPPPAAPRWNFSRHDINEEHREDKRRATNKRSAPRKKYRGHFSSSGSCQKPPQANNAFFWYAWGRLLRFWGLLVARWVFQVLAAASLPC